MCMCIGMYLSVSRPEVLLCKVVALAAQTGHMVTCTTSLQHLSLDQREANPSVPKLALQRLHEFMPVSHLPLRLVQGVDYKVQRHDQC